MAILWKFHGCILIIFTIFCKLLQQTSPIISHMVNLFPVLFVYLFLCLSSLVSTVYIHLSVRPSTGVWSVCLELHPLLYWKLLFPLMIYTDFRFVSLYSSLLHLPSYAVLLPFCFSLEQSRPEMNRVLRDNNKALQTIYKKIKQKLHIEAVMM